VTRFRSPDPLRKRPRSAFLANVLLSLRKRRKAVSHQVRTIEVEKVLERTDGTELEKLEIECITLHPRPTKVRVFVWEDRWVWVDARSRVGSKGWAWEFTTQGRAAGGVDGRGLVQALEASISAASPVEPDNAGALGAVWEPVLAAGPRLIA
jgi:hypothetical protein